MELAIKEAQKSKQFIGCGVIVVKNRKVLAKAHNKQREANNATAHAEIIAIGLAGKKTGNKSLKECTMFCTCEPCTMCLSAAIFAKIPKLVFGTSMRETFPNNLPITLTTQNLLKRTDHKIKIVSGFMKDECKVLLKT